MRDDYGALTAILRGAPSWAVAYSGGVDSSLVLRCAADAVGAENVMALTFASPLHPLRESREAAEFVSSLGVEFEIVNANPLEIPEVAGNRRDRCYHCKRKLFSALIAAAGTRGITRIADGTNADDPGVYRPGLRAVEELGVFSPLREAEIGRAHV